MPSVLTISSQVAAGPVGNSAIVPALLALGVTPVALPAAVLSFHPGHGVPRGMALPADVLAEMLESLDKQGFLAACRVVLTGYFASAGQVMGVADAIARLKDAREVFHICDPVLGDDDALYVKEDVAVAIRDRLVPLCDLVMPNIFELGWLTGVKVIDSASAELASAQFTGKQVIATSVPAAAGKISTVLFGDGAPLAVTRPMRPQVPHGTGDLLSGLIAGHVALGQTPRACLSQSIDILETAIAASDGNILNLAGGLRGVGA